MHENVYNRILSRQGDIQKTSVPREKYSEVVYQQQNAEYNFSYQQPDSSADIKDPRWMAWKDEYDPRMQPQTYSDPSEGQNLTSFSNYWEQGGHYFLETQYNQESRVKQQFLE
jgi:hypothetical protein